MKISGKIQKFVKNPYHSVCLTSPRRLNTGGRFPFTAKPTIFRFDVFILFTFA